MIFYIHGLNSGSKSEKLSKLKNYFKEEIVVGLDYDSKSLDDYDFVLQHLRTQIDKFEHHNQILFVGTSLGGYWCNQLSDIYKCKKVLLNPCLFPSKMLLKNVDRVQTIFETGETYIFTQQMLDALSKNENNIYKDKTLCLLELGDEVLDNTLNQGIFENTISYTGGNHRFARFEEVLPSISLFYMGNTK
jgi:predicted esterase YcpF (UPF0227 family)